jgi:hypothetical protein
MKTTIVGALAILIATPAFAQAPTMNLSPPGVTTPHAVYGPGGKVIGTDPDASVRFEILRDSSKPYR